MGHGQSARPLTVLHFTMTSLADERSMFARQRHGPLPFSELRPAVRGGQFFIKDVARECVATVRQQAVSLVFGTHPQIKRGSDYLIP